MQGTLSTYMKVRCRTPIGNLFDGKPEWQSSYLIISAGYFTLRKTKIFLHNFNTNKDTANPIFFFFLQTNVDVYKVQ